MNAVYNDLTGQWEEVPYSEEQASSGPIVTKPPATNPPDNPGTSDPNPPIIHDGTTTTAGPVDKHGNPKPREDDYTYFELEDGEWVGKSKHPELKIPTTTATAARPTTITGGDAFQPVYPGYQSAGPFMPRQDTFKPRTESFEFPDFKFDAFAPSSWEDAENEPGYKAAREQLRKQIEAGAAHKGIVRSGMTLGDIYSNLDALSQQNFGQFDARRFRNYGENRANAFGTWEGNLGKARNKFLDEFGIDAAEFDKNYLVDKDQYNFRATDLDRSNNFAFNVADAKNKDALARWQEQVRSLTQLGRPVG